MAFDPQILQEVVQAQNLEDQAADFALRYLSHFFHNPVDGELTTEKVAEYTRQFQEAIGVEADGQLDSQVIRAMETMPRCGCKDYSSVDTQAAGVKSWRNGSTVTYFIEKFVNGLPQADQVALLDLAFRQWAEVADLKFKRVESASQANIVISTGRGAGDQFDGPSGTLAWAYLPPRPDFQGQLLMRFDLDETWTKSTAERGILYLNVATHEIGHLLGLEHSRVSSALMAPYYAVGISKPQRNDDVSRIQAIYGKPSAPPPPPKDPVAPGKIKVEITVNSMDDIKILGRAEDGVAAGEMDFNLV